MTKHTPATPPANGTMTVPDGYAGATVKLSLHPLTIDNTCVKLAVEDKPWLIRWVYRTDWNKATAERDAIRRKLGEAE